MRDGAQISATSGGIGTRCITGTLRRSVGAPRERRGAHAASRLDSVAGTVEPRRVLISALPGLRELRAPLAAGYLWLATLWLIFAADLPSAREFDRGPFGRFVDIGALLSGLGSAVALTVAAYVIGSVVIDIQTLVGVYWSRWRDETLLVPREFREQVQTSRRTTSMALSPGADALVITVLKPLVPYLADLVAVEAVITNTNEEPMLKSSAYNWAETMVSGRSDVASSAELADKVRLAAGALHLSSPRTKWINWIDRNRELLKTRLLDLSSALYTEVDRPDAEATFRMALWPPLVVALVYLAATDSPWWLAGLALAAAVAAQWIALRRRANDALITAIAAKSELHDIALHGAFPGYGDWRAQHAKLADAYADAYAAPQR